MTTREEWDERYKTMRKAIERKNPCWDMSIEVQTAMQCVAGIDLILERLDRIEKALEKKP